VWGAYRDRMRRYVEREMWADAARVYEQAMARGVRPDAVEDLDLLSAVAHETGPGWLNDALSAEEKRLIPQRSGVVFGGKLRLDGYAFERQGGAVVGRFYFRALAPLDRDWTLWVHVVAAEPAQLSVEDRAAGYVSMDTRVPAVGWEVGRLYEVTSRQKLPAGRYEVHAGLWRWEDGTRLWRDDRPDEHELNLGWIEP